MTCIAQAKVEVLPNAELLARQAADWLCEQALAKNGRFSVCLSGGSTPRRLYELLAMAPRSAAFPWLQTDWFWGDERFVPHSHPDSNYRMAREALFKHVRIPPANIHAVLTDNFTPQASALAYQSELQSYYGAMQLDPARPLFDVMLLGLGPDGHTASLFPGDAMLQERERWVGAVIGVKDEARITLTYPVLQSARATAFLVAGADKRAVLDRVLSGDSDLPAARLQPQGSLTFFCDSAARPEPTL